MYVLHIVAVVVTVQVAAVVVVVVVVIVVLLVAVDFIKPKVVGLKRNICADVQ